MVTIAFFFCAVAVKLFVLQIVQGTTLQAKALDQWTRDVPLVAERGGIYDTTGVLLAGTTTSYTVYARPVELQDIDATAGTLADILYIDYDKILAKLSRRGVSEITIAKKVTKDQVLAIMTCAPQGIYFSRDIARYYPYGDCMCQLLGFCDADVYGQSGLELYYDQYLKGLDGYQLTEADIRGNSLNDKISYIPAVDGMNVVLSVDKSIQFFAESAVKNAYLHYGAQSAACLVMDATTGGIVAMAQAPSFDLNAVPRDDLAALFGQSKLSCVNNVYEMGSTFKILTMAIALNEGVVDVNDTFFCGGSKVVDGQTIKCWKTRGHGSQTFAEAVQNSCNCAFMELALRVGTAKMYQYFRRLGLTEKSGIDVQGEGSGLLLPEDSVKPVDLARIGFGQAIAVTPLALVRAVCAAVNGGWLLTPHMMQGVYDTDGKLVQTTHTNAVRVLSDQTSATVRTLLQGVVDKGSGRLAGVAGYAIGGKTGTAQKYKNGGIDRGKYLSSFVGFASVDDPRYVVLFYVDEPQGYLYYGSQVAAPYVGEIFANIFAYCDWSKVDTEAPPTFEMPDLLGKTYGEARGIAAELGLYLEAGGEGTYVTYQFPVAGAQCTQRNVLYIDLAGEG